MRCDHPSYWTHTLWLMGSWGALEGVITSRLMISARLAAGEANARPSVMCRCAQKARPAHRNACDVRRSTSLMRTMEVQILNSVRVLIYAY